jgi:hypothetical protein
MNAAAHPVAIITGAGRGIGAGLTAAFRRGGYAVVAISRSIPFADDPDLLTVPGDITDDETSRRVVEQTLERFGRIDSLINNAGVYIGKPFTDYTSDDYAAITAVNLAGFFQITQRAIGPMLTQGVGHIVNISTSLVDHADSTQVVEYGASADAVLSGQAPPAEGARFDFYLEGPVSGPKLQGMFRGIDYIYFRADGRAGLHIHGEITTADGKKIALEAGGVAVAEEGSPVFQLREHVSLMSNHPELSWVNPIEVWARGVVDVSTRQVHVTANAV